MIFRQLFDDDSSTFTYLLGDETSGLAVIVDPVIRNVDRYIKVLAELELRLHLSIDTHTHADHITAHSELRDTTGCRILVARQSRANCGCGTFDGSRMLHIGNVKLMPVFTPGHTPDSYSFFTIINGQPALLTGDTLLIGGTGRTDFQGGCAATQYDSIFGILLHFSDDTLVYPGHDYHGRHASTIGAERSGNARLRVAGKRQYISLMSNLNLPAPKLMRQALAANVRCGRLVHAHPPNRSAAQQRA